MRKTQYLILVISLWICFFYIKTLGIEITKPDLSLVHYVKDVLEQDYISKNITFNRILNNFCFSVVISYRSFINLFLSKIISFKQITNVEYSCF